MKLLKISGLTFFLYLAVMLLVKSINEISNNSIQYFANLDELLLLVLITGLLYYLSVIIAGKFLKNEEMKQNDIFSSNFINLKLSRSRVLLVSLIAASIISIILYNKIIHWNEVVFVIIPAIFCFVFLAIFYSLKES